MEQLLTYLLLLISTKRILSMTNVKHDNLRCHDRKELASFVEISEESSQAAGVLLFRA